MACISGMFLEKILWSLGYIHLLLLVVAKAIQSSYSTYGLSGPSTLYHLDSTL